MKITASIARTGRTAVTIYAFGFVTAIAAAQARGPFPRQMPGYEFHGSLAAAINAARGKDAIVVYSYDSVRLRDQLPWLVRQQALFEHPAVATLLGAQPLVCLQHDRGAGKTLPIPKTGLSILSPDGRRVTKTLDLAATPNKDVPQWLATHLRATVLENVRPAFDAEKELQGFRGKRAMLLNAIDAGDTRQAEAICRTEERRRPHGFVARLLRLTLRNRTLSREFYRNLPADRAHLDSVCVVADEGSFLRAIEHWDDGPIFPILYLDTHYLPLFLAAYRPRKVVFLPKRPNEDPPTVPRVFASYARAFGSGSARTEKDAVRLWRNHDTRAPGVVLTHPDSPMLAAGVALAAGRRQLLAMLPPASTNRRADARTMVALREDLTSRFRRHLIEAEQMYDEVDFVTLASEQPYRYWDELAADRSSYALDDAVARDECDFPFAFVGRLLGDRSQSLYMAMCSLFLSPERARLFSNFRKRGILTPYTSDRAARFLQDNLPVQNDEHGDATLTRWRDHDGFGLVHVNSTGDSRSFTTSGERGSVADVPLTEPSIVSYVHAQSLADPYDADTIGGRWIHNGAYSFFGAIDEPHIDAYVNFYAVCRRALEEGQPLGAAHRLLPERLRWRPWKLMLIGDPMLRLRARAAAKKSVRLPVPDTVGLELAATENPFRLAGEPRAIFDIQCALLRGEREATVDGLIELLGSRAPVASDDTRRVLGDLAAECCRTGAGLATLRRLWPVLEKADIRSRRLSYVAHDVIARHLRGVAADPTRVREAELIDLALHHLRLGYSRPMYKAIGRIYKSVLDGIPDGKRLRVRIEKAARRLLKQHRDIRAFLSAL